ncbi:MAG: four helix bundle protein [Anaerolineae bacterium]
MQSFSEWLATVPETITNDPLWRMKIYRMALFLGDRAWHDVTKLVSDRRTVGLADQLFRAVGSIGANIAEGYSRQSGKDRTRFYEYALGSTQESRHWYNQVAEHRINLLAEIARLLLSIIPQEHVRNLAEEPASYEIDLVALLDAPPLPR